MSALHDPTTLTWRKSSYSDGTGGSCVEVAEWRTSSYSNGDNGLCVEVADNLPGIIPVRDSKTAPRGPALVFDAATWAAFIRTVKRGGGIGG
ncbi:DUF397 domain-containing protein [Streptomyces sp. C36]|uniref:DUF397 domain-containing protein n=1 Tax=Streptomyces sp. C36 TaxID=3237122 RepID=UPI0034C61444